MTARLTAWSIIVFARLLTGLRSLWHDGAPSARQTLYFANHTSHADFVLLWSALPPDLRTLTRPVAAADYWQRPGLRSFIGLRVFNAVLIDRQGGVGAGDAVERMAGVLSSGDSLIMFPEGTRNTSDAVLLPFRSGLYHLAKRSPEVRLVPVWIDNLRRVLPKGSLLPLPLACAVHFGPPLELQQDEGKHAFLERARAAMLALRPALEGEE